VQGAVCCASPVSERGATSRQTCPGSAAGVYRTVGAQRGPLAPGVAVGRAATDPTVVGCDGSVGGVRVELALVDGEGRGIDRDADEVSRQTIDHRQPRRAREGSDPATSVDARRVDTGCPTQIDVVVLRA